MIPTASKLTYDDYCLIPEDNKRHEIIDGGHYVSPAPSFPHQNIVLNLAMLLRQHTRTKELGIVAIAPFDVLLSHQDIVQPDIIFVSSAKASLITRKNASGVLDLIGEVLSESNRRHDEIVKRKLYERFEVQEYWIVDPELETVKIYRLVERAYGKPLLLSREAGDVLESPLLPGFSSELDAVFAA